jgi:hypothetical protein
MNADDPGSTIHATHLPVVTDGQRPMDARQSSCSANCSCCSDENSGCTCVGALVCDRDITQGQQHHGMVSQKTTATITRAWWHLGRLARAELRVEIHCQVARRGADEVSARSVELWRHSDGLEARGSGGIHCTRSHTVEMVRS